MIEDFMELLNRQTASAELLEARLRALELIVAAGEYRFLSLALEEVEAASEQMSGLELSRALVLSSAGFDEDATASQVLDTLPKDEAERQVLTEQIDDLRQAMLRLGDARARTDVATRQAIRDSQHREKVAQTFATV